MTMKEERYDLKSRSISVVYNPNPKLFFLCLCS